ncbi:hypothetical protein U0L90_05700 [Flavobacteriaceae sp. LMIT009]
MKTKFKNALLLTFFALLTLTSCQNEFTEVTEPDVEQVIAPESQLANLMLSTSVNAGTVDNIMDNADCMSIELPVNIIVNGITITIETIDDLELIHDIFEEYLDDEDVIDFIFPITIVLNDYTEIVIETREELNSFIDTCEEEEVIECVNFVYPISFSIYNTFFQVIETVTIENRRELFNFMQRIRNADQALLASLNFPVKLEYSNGEIVEVHNNNELERALNEAEEMCRPDNDCDIDEVTESLVECHWMIHYYNEDDNYRPFALKFKTDGELKIINSSATDVRTGKWETVETDDGVILVISEVNELVQEINGRWVIVECDDDRFKLIRPADTAAGTDAASMLLKQRCADEPDCSPQEIREELQDCRWYSGTNISGNTDLGKFYFGDDHELTVEDLANNTEITGYWSIELTDYGIKLLLELPEPYAHYSGYWKVFECGDGRIKVMREDRYIVFEQDCEDECVMDVYDMKEFLLDCRVNGTVYDENENLLAEYGMHFNPNNGFVFSDAAGTAYSGGWVIHGTTNDVLSLVLETATGSFVDGEWTLIDCYEDTLRFKQETSAGYRYLEIEKDCDNPFECFEDKDVVLCDDGDEFDGITTFNLNEVYDECPNDDVEITFHTSEEDANEGVNAVSSEYTNPNNQTPLWVRVTVAGTNRYEIFFVVLYVEDCTPSCTESEVDDYLMTANCNWSPTSVDGSNDFSAFEFYFNDGQELVIRDAYNNETLATWSTTTTNDGEIIIIISQLEGNLEVFNGEWKVTNCNVERLDLKNLSDNTEIVLLLGC